MAYITHEEAIFNAGRALSRAILNNEKVTLDYDTLHSLLQTIRELRVDNADLMSKVDELEIEIEDLGYEIENLYERE